MTAQWVLRAVGALVVITMIYGMVSDKRDEQQTTSIKPEDNQ